MTSCNPDPYALPLEGFTYSLSFDPAQVAGYVDVTQHASMPATQFSAMMKLIMQEHDATFAQLSQTNVQTKCTVIMREYRLPAFTHEGEGE